MLSDAFIYFAYPANPKKSLYEGLWPETKNWCRNV